MAVEVQQAEVGVDVGKSRRAALTAADELISEEMHELTDDEKSKFKAALPDILNDSPRTTLAATRIAKCLAKLVPTVQETFKQIFLPNCRRIR